MKNTSIALALLLGVNAAFGAGLVGVPLSPPPSSGGGGTVPTNILNGNYILKTNGTFVGTLQGPALFLTPDGFANQSFSLTTGTDPIFTMQHVTGVPGLTTGNQFQGSSAAFYTDLLNMYGTFISESGEATLAVRDASGSVTLSSGTVLTQNSDGDTEIVGPNITATKLDQASIDAGCSATTTDSGIIAGTIITSETTTLQSSRSILFGNVENASVCSATAQNGSVAYAGFTTATNCSTSANNSSTAGGIISGNGLTVNAFNGSWGVIDTVNCNNFFLLAQRGSRVFSHTDGSSDSSAQGDYSTILVNSEYSSNTDIQGFYSDGMFTVDNTTNCNFILRNSFMSIDAQAQSDINVTAIRSLVVGTLPSSLSRTFDHEVGVVAPDGSMNEISTNGFIGNGNGLTNLSTSPDVAAQWNANDISSDIVRVYGYNGDTAIGVFPLTYANVQGSIPTSAGPWASVYANDISLSNPNGFVMRDDDTGTFGFVGIDAINIAAERITSGTLSAARLPSSVLTTNAYRSGTTTATTLAISVTNVFSSTLGTTNYTFNYSFYGAFASIPLVSNIIKNSNNCVMTISSVVGGGKIDWNATRTN